MKKVFIFIAALAVTAILLVSPLIFAFGKTGKNTQVLNKDYSLIGKKEIIARLQRDFPLPQNLILRTPGRDFNLPVASISASIDYNTTASNLLFRRLYQGAGNYFRAFFEPKNFHLEISYSQADLDNALNDIASQIDKPFIPSELYLDGRAVKNKPGVPGIKTDVADLKNQVISSLEYYQVSPPVSIPTSSVGTLPDDSQVNAAIKFAATLIGKSLEIAAPDQTVAVDDKTLISWVDFTAGCRRDRIDDYLKTLSLTLKKDPVEAVFQFENGKVLEFKPSSNGYTLDTAKTADLLCQSLSQVAAAADPKYKLTFPVNTIEARTKNSDVNNFGIKELLGRGTSTFKTSADIRNYNVAKGAGIVNNVLVAPGETFSFIKTLGDVSIENGFKQAYVIRAGKTVLDVGGGICQVSTTLFRAMLNAGMDITSRQNHAYRVHYYEEDMPPGYDATVFIPSPDLKFVNDTGHYVLIQNTYDGKNKSLTYEIYGTSDGRKVDISNYHQWGYTAAPPDVWVDDPTLPPGKVVQDEHAIPGLKTAFDWKVTRDGTVIHQKTFTSNYVPWAAVFRRGPQI